MEVQARTFSYEHLDCATRLFLPGEYLESLRLTVRHSRDLYFSRSDVEGDQVQQGGGKLLSLTEFQGC